MSHRTDTTPDEEVDDVPVITCERCDDEWRLTYELETLQVGNQAVEQFALDHERHTGHFPDDVTPWIATCRRCPDREAFLSEGPARRWSLTHARHARHDVTLAHGNEAEETVVDPGE